MRKTKRWVLLGIGFVLIGAIAANVLAYNHAKAMLRFSAARARTGPVEGLSFKEKVQVLVLGVDNPRPKSTLTPAQEGLPFEENLVPGPNGIKLATWYLPVPRASGLVILYHGYASEKSTLLENAKGFRELGYSTLLVDFRGSGGSSEAYTSVGYDEAEDVVATVGYAKAHFPPTKLVLFGHSMGGAAVLRAVGRLGVQPDAVIIEAVFDRMLTTVKHRFEAMHVPSFPSAWLLLFWGGKQLGFDAFQHNPVDYATGVTCPVLFFHGKEDARARVEEARRVFEEVRGPKEFREFSGSGHHSPVVKFPEEWKAAVKAFLESHGLGAETNSATMPSGK